MSVPSLNSVHVLCRFTFSFPAMNFSFCRFTHHPSHTTLSHTPSFTHNFVTRHLSTHHLSHTTLSHTIFRHTIFHTPLCHTPSFSHNFVTRSLSQTTFTHTIFHTQLCHTLSFTHNFHTHTHARTIFHTQLCHTPPSLSHTIFHIQLCHTQLCFTSRSSTTSFVFPSFPVPATTFAAHYWKKLTCGLSGPLFFF